MKASTWKSLLGKSLLGKSLLGLVAGAVAVTGTGCARQTAEQAQAVKAGSQMQQAGIMSEPNYVRIRELGHSVSKTHTISDADLNWTVALLSGAGNPIARARAMTVLSEVRPMSPAQKAKVAPVIAPYLNSSNQLDRIGAQRVERVLQA